MIYWSPHMPMPHQDPTPWKPFKRPFVRDLAYTLACPSVLSHWVDHQPLPVNNPVVTLHSSDFWNAQFAAYLPRLQALDKTNRYQELTRFLMNRPSPYRLGFHFEGLIHFWLIDGFKLGCHPYEVLAHNMQLYQGNQTTGELDFVIRNHQSGQVEHWELAIKFFVGTPPYCYANWVGLNSRDNLKLKMMHMHTKQFREVQVDLDGYSQLKIDKRIAVIKGRFFKPITDNEFIRPDWLTKTFPLHDWIDADNSIQLKQLQLENLRPAHYVEWFTKRDFYDNHHKPESLEQPHPLDTGLYFEKNKPIVIYRANRNRMNDSF